MLRRLTKTTGYEDPSIWYKFGKLATTTQSVNMGQGYPDWQPPEFFIESLQKNISGTDSNHQYSRSSGNIKLCETLAKYYNASFKKQIDPMTEILVANGGISVLYNTITALVEPGDEVLLLEPFYESYFAEIKLMGGNAIGVPMIPPQIRNKNDFKYNGDEKGMEKFYSKFRDTWTIDFERFEAALSNKTKLVLLNTPNNPTGKILTYEELRKIAELVKKFPNVVVFMDEVYEHMTYDSFQTLPRMASFPGMWNRTITMMSAGKTFSATGVRLGWAIGPNSLIKKISAVFRYNSFCMYDPFMKAIADCLDIAMKSYKGYNNYYSWLRAHYLKQRNYTIKKLANCNKFDLDFYIPEGGYFLVASLEGKDIKPTKYRLEGDENLKEGEYLKDYNYLIDLAYNKNVVGIPCSVFYTEPNKPIGENFIRLAFCKQSSTIDNLINNFENK
jgi:kynurenine--oxoglutarate transaminase/cysteine-S-conjugate beta-lyase/glutamine--phenylpyruvate transaminase